MKPNLVYQESCRNLNIPEVEHTYEELPFEINSQQEITATRQEGVQNNDYSLYFETAAIDETGSDTKYYVNDDLFSTEHR